MPASHRVRLWPRRLRWRLVVGFALTVALLQVVLTGTERVLLERALLSAIQSNLESTIRSGLQQTMPQQKSVASPASGPLLDKEVRVWLQKSKSSVALLQQSSALLKKDLIALLTTLAATGNLPVLAGALAQPDQPVALLDGHGNVLAQQSALTKDKARVHPLDQAVLKSLLAAAPRRVATLSRAQIYQVATPDGPYLVLLWPTANAVLPAREANAGLKMLSLGPKAFADPRTRAALHGLHPTRLVVLLAHRLGETEQTVQTVTLISLGGSLAVIALTVLSSLLVVGRALRPLAAITRGAERLAQGDYSHRVALDGDGDEVGRLGMAFDAMAAAIATAFTTQRRFVADASHELRTPLTALRGYTDVLLMDGGDAATSERVLRAMQEDLSRMSRLVDDLLTLARLDGGAPLQVGPIAVADLLDAAADEARAITQGAQHITACVAAPDLCVCGDYDRLHQVLSNVVGNACAYSPPGSTIALHAGRCDDWAAIAVQDNGPGIPPADLARLGERFYRGDTTRSRRTGGSGLGLAIARTIVETHGGTLAVESTLGAGTTVTIRLPLAPSAVSAPPVPGHPALPSP